MMRIMSHPQAKTNSIKVPLRKHSSGPDPVADLEGLTGKVAGPFSARWGSSSEIALCPTYICHLCGDLSNI